MCVCVCVCVCSGGGGEEMSRGEGVPDEIKQPVFQHTETTDRQTLTARINTLTAHRYSVFGAKEEDVSFLN